jgi:hypothetical protein
MAEGKKGFLLYADLINMVEKLPKEKAGELFLTILEYVNDRDPNPEDILVQVAFEPIKAQLKRDLRKYEAYIDKQRENGKKGGRPHKEENPEKGLGFLANPTKPKKADNDNVNDNDNVTDKVIERVFRPPAQDEVFRLMMERGLNELKAKTESAKFFNYYSANGWKVGRNKMKSWPHAVTNWIGNMDDFNKKQSNGTAEKPGTSAARIQAAADF